MNCTDFTSSNGNGNAQQNYGAANCGARAKHHHNSLTDFLDRSVPDAAKHGRANADTLRTRANFADSPNLVTEPLWEPRWSSHRCLSSHRLRQKLRQQHDWSSCRSKRPTDVR